MTSARLVPADDNPGSSSAGSEGRSDGKWGKAHRQPWRPRSSSSQRLKCATSSNEQRDTRIPFDFIDFRIVKQDAASWVANSRDYRSEIPARGFRQRFG